MVIVDKNNILVVELSYRNPIAIYNFNDMVFKIDDMILHAFLLSYHHDGSKRKWVCVTKNNNIVLIETEQEKIIYKEDFPFKTTTFFAGSTFEQDFGFLLQRDLKQTNSSIVEFLERPNTIRSGLRYQLFNRKDIVNKTKAYTQDNVIMELKI